MTRWILVFVAALLSLPLQAQERTYAIMSLVGDSLLIVHRDMATGSRLDKNVRDVVAIPNPALDNAMVLALDDGVKASEPRARTVLLGERTQGFIAPFVFFRLALVELATGKVLAEQTVRESTSIANQRSAGAWDALTAEQKVRILNQLVRRETQRALPELLGK